MVSPDILKQQSKKMLTHLKDKQIEAAQTLYEQAATRPFPLIPPSPEPAPPPTVYLPPKPQTQNTHATQERARRVRHRESFERLAQQLPHLTGPASEHEILQETISYIERLQNEETDLTNRIENLKAENQKLENKE